MRVVLSFPGLPFAMTITAEGERDEESSSTCSQWKELLTEASIYFQLPWERRELVNLAANHLDGQGQTAYMYMHMYMYM